MYHLMTGRISPCCGCIWQHRAGQNHLSLVEGQKCCPACDNTTPPGGYRNVVSDRKLRLAGVACLRHSWRGLTAPSSRPIVELAEKIADGEAQTILSILEDISSPDHMCICGADAQSSLSSACIASGNLFTDRAQQAYFFREVVGNPFRPCPWRWDKNTLFGSGHHWTIVSLAQAAYDARDPANGHISRTRLGVLSDALEESGYGNDELLQHLRSPGPHVRGCWALDLVLQKE
jgi:hypothetical protein